MLKQGKVKAALFHAFEKVQMDLVKQSVEEDFSLQVCGCTAVCLLQHPDYDTVWVANLGESKAVMISPTTHGVVAETVDHKPSVASERERVERSGMELQTTIHDDGTTALLLGLRSATCFVDVINAERELRLSSIL